MESRDDARAHSTRLLMRVVRTVILLAVASVPLPGCEEATHLGIPGYRPTNPTMYTVSVENNARRCGKCDSTRIIFLDAFAGEEALVLADGITILRKRLQSRVGQNVTMAVSVATQNVETLGIAIDGGEIVAVVNPQEVELPHFRGHPIAGLSSRQEVSYGKGQTVHERVQGECRPAIDDAGQDGRRCGA